MPAAQSTDERLLALAVSGDSLAFQILYERHLPYVRWILFHSFRLTEDFADIAQDVFLQVWLKGGSFDPARGRVRPWIGVIARSRALDWIRRRRDVVGMAVGMESSVKATDHVGRITIRRGWIELSEAQRDLLELSFIEGFSHAQIADRLQRPLGTVKTQIRAGVIALREVMARKAS